MSDPETELRDTSPPAIIAAARAHVLRKGRNPDGNTARSLAGIWVRFVAYLKERGRDPLRPDLDDARGFRERYSRRYFDSHPGQKVANPATLNTYTSGVREYFRYLGLRVDPEEWPRYERTRPRSRVLSGPEMASLLDVARAADADDTPRKGHPFLRLRYPVLHTLAHTGVRRSELVALTLRDLRRDDSEVFVSQGKGAKDRRVVVAPRVFDVLDDHLSRYPAATEEAPIFRVTDDAVERMVRSCAAMAMLEGQVTPHVLRHSYATALFEAGVQERYVALQMGHTPPGVTRGTYDHPDRDRERVRAAVLPVLERLYEAAAVPA